MEHKYTPQTDKDKIEYLMATDGRRESHISQLQKDVKALTTSVDNLTTAIVGSPLNKKSGFIDLMDTLDEKVKALRVEVNDLNKFQSTIQPQFNIGKYVFLLFVLGMVGSVVNNIMKPKDKIKTELNR